MALQDFIGKVIVEPDFRRRLIEDPAAALEAAGLHLSDKHRQALLATSRGAREQMLASLQERTAPWGWGEIFVPVVYL